MNSENASQRLTIVCEVIFAKMRLTSGVFEGATGAFAATANAARWDQRNETKRDSGKVRTDEQMKRYM